MAWSIMLISNWGMSTMVAASSDGVVHGHGLAVGVEEGDDAEEDVLAPLR